MNEMLMVAMAAMATNPKNGAATAQTILGASDGVPQVGRMALGMMQQQNHEAQRVNDLRAVGRELLSLVPDRADLPKIDFAKLPFLKRALELAEPGVTTPKAADAKPNNADEMGGHGLFADGGTPAGNAAG